MRVTAGAEQAVQGAAHVVGMWWRVLRLAYLRFCFSGAMIMASAIAFYTVICLGPLGILYAAGLQLILGPGSASYTHLQEAVNALGATVAGPVMRQVDGLIANPHVHLASALSVLLLLWAAIRLFETVERSLTEVWPGKILRGFFTRKLISLSALIVSGLLLSSFVLAKAFLATARAWLQQFPQLDQQALSGAGHPLLMALEFGLTLVAFVLLYKYMPVQRVPLRVAVVGALSAAALWHGASRIFAAMIGVTSEANNMYGGLAGVVVFSMWAFLGAEVLLFGAHFAVSYEHVFVKRRDPRDDDILVGIAQRRAELAWSFGQTVEAMGRETRKAGNPATGGSALHAPLNGVIIAGGRLAPEFAAAVGADNKGLIPILGKPSIEYVVEAMRGVPNIHRIVIVGPRNLYAGHPVAAHVDLVVEEGSHIVENLARAIEALGDDKKILMAVSDTPLLTTRALVDFISQCPPDSDLCLPVVRREATQKLFGHRVWVYLPFKEGWVTHTCNYLFNPTLLPQCRPFVEAFVAVRGNPWVAARSIGPGFALRFALSWKLPFLRYDTRAIARKVQQLTGARNFGGIIVEHPEMALDIDRPTDVAVIEQFMRDRAGSVTAAG